MGQSILTDLLVKRRHQASRREEDGGKTHHVPPFNKLLGHFAFCCLGFVNRCQLCAVTGAGVNTLLELAAVHNNPPVNVGSVLAGGAGPDDRLRD